MIRYFIRKIEIQEDMLETISDFNMEARYGDYKYKFEKEVFDEI